MAMGDEKGLVSTHGGFFPDDEAVFRDEGEVSQHHTFLSAWATSTRCSSTTPRQSPRELELTLTGRECGQEERAPMCGVPFHSAESYNRKAWCRRATRWPSASSWRTPSWQRPGKAGRDPGHHPRHGAGKTPCWTRARNNYICSLYYQWGDGGAVLRGRVHRGTHRGTAVRLQRDRLLHLLTDRLARYDPSEDPLKPPGHGTDRNWPVF